MNRGIHSATMRRTNRYWGRVRHIAYRDAVHEFDEGYVSDVGDNGDAESVWREERKVWYVLRFGEKLMGY